MDRLLGTKTIGVVVSLYVTLVAWLGDRIGTAGAQFFAGLEPVRMVFGEQTNWLAFAAYPLLALLALFCLRPVWRTLWRMPGIGRYFRNRFFPDLNGDWDVQMQSNWPMVEKLKDAAASASGARFDVKSLSLPEFMQVEKLSAKIVQNWSGVSMTMTSSDPNSRIKSSYTIAFDLLRKQKDGKHQLAYTYVQDNRAETKPSIDGDGLLGAALLDVSDDDNMLTGLYFTNRNWQQAMSTAGTITLTRRTRA